ncbi:MAG: HAD-IC family P-type ATPase, partial [Bauldia sp.]
MNDTTPALTALAATAHAQPCDEVMAAAGVTFDGLGGHEAARRLAAHGPNQVSAVRRRSALAALLAQFNNVLIYVLLAAAAVTAALGHMVDTGVILGVVVINALIGFIQERRAERSLDAIRGLIALRATVVRDGRRLSLPAEDIVPGDILLVEAGDKVPADLRLVRTRGLQVQEAILTGESVPTDKSIDPVAVGAPLGDRTSIAFAGTIVSRGQGRGVAIATGNTTELGRISAMLQSVETPETPLTRQLAGLGRTVTWLILLLSVAVV